MLEVSQAVVSRNVVGFFTQGDVEQAPDFNQEEELTQEKTKN